MVNKSAYKHKYNAGTCSLTKADTFTQADRDKTIAAGIMKAHTVAENEGMFGIKFDCLASHDITYVGIIQTARAAGLEKFPVPYVLTNCHNSLCAVGGTINEDDHRFGRSAAEKYGGIFVPAHQAVIHSYMREMMTGCGKMILGSDSHTRYGALGTMGIGEGGPEIVKQLLSRTYDVARPDVVAVFLSGKVRPGIGPQDVALALIKEAFPDGFVKNKVLEFIGPGVEDLSVDFRNGIDVMTTETTCLSSVWQTDDKVREYYRIHERENDFKKMSPQDGAVYDALIHIELDRIESMIALPFHPSNVYSINELKKNAREIFTEIDQNHEKKTGKSLGLLEKISADGIRVDQGVIAGCSGGTYENLMAAGDILRNGDIGNDMFVLSLYPGSQPIYEALVNNGTISIFMKSGSIVRSAFCGPCFGAGDTPFNTGFSIRHTTRNFPSREGSKPSDGQSASVALMDARSIAATAVNGGLLTAATDIVDNEPSFSYNFDSSIYKKRVFNGFGKADPAHELAFGPNIKDWPDMLPMPENLLVKICAYIPDDVTTTDELIPSGETSSYRSNPYKLSEFTLSRRVPEYVHDAKNVDELEKARREDTNDEKPGKLKKLPGLADIDFSVTGIGSSIYAKKPGDGSAREQAASCQKVLGSWANFAEEYATKRYRSNCANWGIIPFIITSEEAAKLENYDWIYIQGIRKAIENGADLIEAAAVNEKGKSERISLDISDITGSESRILISGCLINNYAGK